VGYWSTAIFGNDLASDVRGTYRELLEDRVPDDQALLKVQQEFAHAASDPDNRVGFGPRWQLPKCSLGAWTAESATKPLRLSTPVAISTCGRARTSVGVRLHLQNCGACC